MPADWGDAPGAQLGLDVNHGQGLVEIDHVNSESHAQSMNAMAGDNPEAVAVTEVISSQAEQAAQAGPMRVGDGEGGGEIGLPGSIKGLPSRRKHHSPRYFVLPLISGLRP